MGQIIGKMGVILFDFLEQLKHQQLEIILKLQ